MYLSVMGINFAFSYECFHWILELFRQYPDLRNNYNHTLPVFDCLDRIYNAKFTGYKLRIFNYLYYLDLVTFLRFQPAQLVN
jgi:hypothetical protein